MKNEDYGQPLFRDMTYCTRCCMPESNEGVKFDDMGVCQACQSAEQKIHIDWGAREKQLRELLQAQKDLGNDYDCLVPISGGKDSTFQLHVLTQVYGMRVLACTFSHSWFTETGKYNLNNALEQFDVDHIIFTPKRGLVNRLARRSLVMIGDSCWHCHQGVGAFPLQVAVKYRIPLVVWGESIAESSGRATHYKPMIKFDRDYFTRVSAKIYAEDMACDEIPLYDLAGFRLPSYRELEDIGVLGIHLGDYMFWDDERQMEFVRDTYAWREDVVEGTYKQYKSVECRMAGVHDYAKFLKRGFGRGTDHASADVRAGLLTREEAFELAKKHDVERPAALDFYLGITGYTEEEFNAIMRQHREGIGVEALSEEKFESAIEAYRSRGANAPGDRWEG